MYPCHSFFVFLFSWRLCLPFSKYLWNYKKALSLLEGKVIIVFLCIFRNVLGLDTAHLFTVFHCTWYLDEP